MPNDELSNQSEALYWKFDISTFQLLGRELITDRITALFELVKNCYDANATKVYVEFHNINPLSQTSKIVIRDNGLGMSYTEVKDKWMVIGTSSKRINRTSPPPFNRKLVGKKGVGRFAVDKLGSKLIMRTKQKDSDINTYLELNWKSYEDLSVNADRQNEMSKKKLFTDIPNKFWTEPTEKKELQGTRLEITDIRDVWTKDDITRGYEELSKLVSPLHKPKYPFDIYIDAPQEGFYKKPVVNNAIKFATEEITLVFDSENQTQEILKHENSILKKIKIGKPLFGFVKFKLYYFNQKAKGLFNSSYQGANIDGIKIYRDGIITTPFAEYEKNDNKKRDILGIDKRRYSGFFDKVSSSDLVGILEITDADNPEIKDATNRQDFVDNNAYKELKQFVIDQIIQLEEYLKSQRNEARENTKSELKESFSDLKNISSIVREIKKQAPKDLKPQLALLETQARKLTIDVNKGIKAFNELEKEKNEDKNLYLSLMSLQEYALEIAHVIRTSLGKEIRAAEFFKRNFPNPNFDAQFVKSAKRLYNEMIRLDNVVEFLLSYSRSNTNFVEINIRELIENLFLNSYRHIFEENQIKVSLEINQTFKIIHNQKFFEDIFENLISNSIKALKSVNNKIIKCTGKIEDDKFIILFSDNGVGISDDDKHRVFNIYFTRTAEQGGAGIGLYIVKTRITSMKGTIEVVENEFKPTGTTLRIELPFINS